MPTYKRHFKQIKKSISSVLNQTYTNIELIIIDDNSKDNISIYNIENELNQIKDSRIYYIQHGINKGACAARNTGIKNAKGEYIAFLDDDDEWLPRKTYEQLIKFKNTSAGLVFCPYYKIRNTQKKVRNKVKTGKVYNQLLYGNFIGSTSCIMITRECLEYIGYFTESLPASQDYDLYIRVAKDYHIEVVNEPLMNYYDHDGERISGDPYKKLLAREYIYNKYKEDIERLPKIKQIHNLRLAYSYSLFKNQSLKKKHWIKAVLA